MIARRWLATAWTAAIAWWAPAVALADDDRNRDAELFGEEEPTAGAAQPGQSPAAPGQRPAVAAPRPTTPTSEAEGGDLGDARLTGQAVENTALLTRDRLQLGGFFYARNSVALAQGQAASDAALGNSTFFETYADGRINERVRVYARGRLVYNPLADAGGTGAAPWGLAAAQTDEVRALLTQLWLKFDIARTVYVTAGRQFVRWGATRFWNPVDVINTSRFNPLLFFDDRVGPTMVKLHLPLEGLGWNFYALLLTENALRMEQVGAAVRGEFVLGTVELGVSTVARKGVDPKAGLDLSAGIGDIDVTAEVSTWFPDGVAPRWSATLGASWTWAYREDDALTVGLEYFHNPQGSTAGAIVDGVRTALLSGKAPQVPAPLYAGQDYLGVLAAVISPGNWSDASVSALLLQNLTDRSGTAQLNLSTRILTDLTLEAFGGAVWGDGEFRGYVPLLQGALAGVPGVAGLLAPRWRAGLNFRVEL
jgi:hypothetical protein